MKLSVVISLICLLLVAPATGKAQSQQSPGSKDGLATVFVRLEHFKFELGKADTHDGSRDGELLMHLFRPLLSTQGELEFEQRGQTLIVTDTPEQAARLRRAVEQVDDIFEPDGLGRSDQGELTSLTVRTNYLLPYFICRGVAGGVGESSERRNTLQDQRDGAFATLLARLLSRPGSFEFGHTKREVMLHDVPERIERMRRFIELVDVPIP